MAPTTTTSAPLSAPSSFTVPTPPIPAVGFFNATLIPPGAMISWAVCRSVVVWYAPSRPKDVELRSEHSCCAMVQGAWNETMGCRLRNEQGKPFEQCLRTLAESSGQPKGREEELAKEKEKADQARKEAERKADEERRAEEAKKAENKDNSKRGLVEVMRERRLEKRQQGNETQGEQGNGEGEGEGEVSETQTQTQTPTPEPSATSEDPTPSETVTAEPSSSSNAPTSEPTSNTSTTNPPTSNPPTSNPPTSNPPTSQPTSTTPPTSSPGTSNPGPTTPPSSTAPPQSSSAPPGNTSWIGGPPSDGNNTAPNGPFGTTTTTTTTTNTETRTETLSPSLTTIAPSPSSSQADVLGDLLDPNPRPGVVRFAICKSYSEALLDATEKLVNDLSSSYIPLDPSTALCVAYVGPGASIEWKPNNTWASYMTNGTGTNPSAPSNQSTSTLHPNASSSSISGSGSSTSKSPNSTATTTASNGSTGYSDNGGWWDQPQKPNWNIYHPGLANVAACCAPDGKLRWPPLPDSPCAIPNNTKMLENFAGCVAAMGAYAVCGENRTGEDGSRNWNWATSRGERGGGGVGRGVLVGLVVGLVGAVAAAL